MGGQVEGTKEVKALPGKGLVKPRKRHPNEQTLRGGEAAECLGCMTCGYGERVTRGSKTEKGAV